MIDILQTVKTIIHSKGSYISVTELQTIPTEDPDFKTFFEQPLLTAELIKIFDALIQLLQGTWNYTKYDLDSDIKYQYSIPVVHYECKEISCSFD
ncbi:hypothetical protein [Chryseobacterium sp. OSA05B]|uniref:hypothetical protein n=1 Tax=Chryseobacterium sp. OSA05B TaxID=2862650 RepID=UPI001CBEEC89|nr:hypothetical protein [Chryseobacterium sp. OSA05B]